MTSNNSPHSQPDSYEASFDPNKGGVSERVIFNYRWLVILLAVLVTAFLGYHAAQQQISASFNRVIPQDHPYIQNYLQYQDELPGLGNTIRIVVEHTQGDIFDADYFDASSEVVSFPLKTISNAVLATTILDLVGKLTKQDN